MASDTHRTLALDLGNSTLALGLFEGGHLLRHSHLPNDASAEQIVNKVRCLTGGQQTASAARNKRRAAVNAARQIKAACGCSVVPERTAPLLAALETAFGLRPLLLTPTAAHGLKIAYRRPAQIGADRVAAALGARKLYPRQNCIIIDCGTATTLTFLSRDGTLLGGAILPGLALWGDALARATAKLPRVTLPRPPAVDARAQPADDAPTSSSPIEQPTAAPQRGRAKLKQPTAAAVATDTASAIRAGLLYGHAGAIRELATRGAIEAFGPRAAARAIRIGTGGQAPHFAAQSCFTLTAPALTLHGLQAYADAHA